MLAINENKNENYMSEKEKLEDIKEEICNATAQWKLLLQRNKITSKFWKSSHPWNLPSHQNISILTWCFYFFSTLDSIFLDF